MPEVKILSRDEIAALNRDGAANLNKDGFYIQLFLFNDSQNHAADPMPFKIATGSLDKIAKTAIGRPWIVHPDYSKHVRGASDNPKDIIKYQKQFAKGETVAVWRNEQSNNVHVIAEVFPEYVADVKAKKIPKSPYLSPLIFVKKEDGTEITDAEVLHVQSVGSPGYDPEIAQISGMCEGMLGECMTELRTLGASGKLREYQEKDSSQFDDNETSQSEKMAGAQAATTLTAEQIQELVKTSIGPVLDERFSAFETKHAKILGASGAAAATEQVTQKPTGATDASDAVAQTSQNIDNIKEHPDFKALSEQVETLKKAKEESDKKSALLERQSTAAKIAELESQLHITPFDKKEARIEELVKSKDDLGVMLKYVQSNKGKILGASGFGEMAELTTEGRQDVSFEDLEMFK